MFLINTIIGINKLLLMNLSQFQNIFPDFRYMIIYI